MPFMKYGDLRGSFGIPSATSFERIRAGVIHVGELIMQGANSRFRSANFDNSGTGWIIRGDGTASFSQMSGLAWKNWTPTYTNLTVGNGSVAAKYVQIGDTVHAFFRIQFGSTTTIDGASVRVSMPVNASGSYTVRSRFGEALFFDNNTNGTFLGTVGWLSATKFVVDVSNASGTYLVNASLSATVPMTWATDDILFFSATYMAA